MYVVDLHLSPSGQNVFIDGNDFLFYNIPTGQILTFSKKLVATLNSIVSDDLNYILVGNTISNILWKVV
jgi:hypothetical protein